MERYCECGDVVEKKDGRSVGAYCCYGCWALAQRDRSVGASWHEFISSEYTNSEFEAYIAEAHGISFEQLQRRES